MSALSPDGTRVAFTRPPESTEGRDEVRLFVSELGREDSVIDLGPGNRVFWSADGKELAVSTFDYTLTVENLHATHEILTLATKKRTRLKLPADHHLMGWSRDGQYFLTQKYMADRDDPPLYDLFLMKRDGSEHKRLNDGRTPIAYAQLSPDAKRVLCFRYEVSESPAQKKAREEAGLPLPRPWQDLVMLDIASVLSQKSFA